LINSSVSTINDNSKEFGSSLDLTDENDISSLKNISNSVSREEDEFDSKSFSKVLRASQLEPYDFTKSSGSQIRKHSFESSSKHSPNSSGSVQFSMN